MTVKLVVFDLDGVLFDGADLHFHALNEALAEKDPALTISAEEHRATYNGRTTAEKLRMLSERKGLDPGAHDEVWARKQALFAEKIKHLRPNHALIDVLARLRASGFRIHVASNSVSATVRGVLGAMGLLGFVDAWFSNESVPGRPKPHPDIYRACFEKAGIDARSAIILEDSYVGRLAALASGAWVLPVSSPGDVTRGRIHSFVRWVESRPRLPTVVIPMAGEGSRFARQGYALPKPLIDIGGGTPMIQAVVENIGVCAKYVFIVQEKHVEDYELQSTLERLAPGCALVHARGTTEGAACSVLLAEEHIDPEAPLLLANSDQLVEWDAYAFLLRAQEADGCISVFRSRDPKFSFAKVCGGRVERVAEKEAISDLATTGVYYWKRGGDFVRYAKQMIQRDVRVRGEFYVCPVYNEAIADGKDVTVMECDAFYCLGTPEDLRQYQACHRVQG
jgi:HAD superfamily hydrolase (TIGR01509 family)